MLVKLSGMTTFVKEEHPQKADLPMCVTLSGSVMLSKQSHPRKASSQMIFVSGFTV